MTVHTEDTGKVSRRSGACVELQVSDVIVRLVWNSVVWLSVVPRRWPEYIDIPRRETNTPHDSCDYSPICETRCRGKRADRQNGVGEGPTFPVLCPLSTFNGAIFRCQSFQAVWSREFSLIPEGKI